MSAKLLALGTLLAVAFACLAQRGGRVPERDMEDAPLPTQEAEFHFLRLEYTDLPQFHRRWGYSSRDGMGAGWWLVDWPAADNHFTVGINRLTRVDTGDPRHVRLTDANLFDYPGSMPRKPDGGTSAMSRSRGSANI